MLHKAELVLGEFQFKKVGDADAVLIDRYSNSQGLGRLLLVPVAREGHGDCAQ